MTRWTSGVVALMASAIIHMLVVRWQRQTVYDQSDLASVGFGWPVPFLIQNQGQARPPFPYEVGLYSILENPTDLRVAAALVDVLGGALALGVVMVLVVSVCRRVRAREQTADSA